MEFPKSNIEAYINWVHGVGPVPWDWDTGDPIENERKRRIKFQQILDTQQRDINRGLLSRRDTEDWFNDLLQRQQQYHNELSDYEQIINQHLAEEKENNDLLRGLEIAERIIANRNRAKQIYNSKRNGFPGP
jgi:septal ring factor EnvC (AmiA/AmiB activator)